MANTGTHEFLRAKIQIGNVKGPVSYNLNQTVFHHDDIPESKRLRRNEVKAWTKSRTLSVDPPSWSKSTKPLQPVIVRRQAENFVKDRGNAYQYNFRAETLEPLRLVEPIDKPTKFHLSAQLESRAMELKDIKSTNRIQNGYFTRTGEMPVHPNLADAEAWKVSTEVNLREKDRKLDKMTMRAQEWTSKVNSAPQKFSKPCLGPLKSAVELQNTIRKQKAEGTFSVKKQVNRPGSAPVDRTKLRNRVAIEKPVMLVTHEHSGVYETNKVDGRSMWSDTGNEKYNSRGDVSHRVNLDALNLQGPNMSQSRLIGRKGHVPREASLASSAVSSSIQ